MSVVYLTVSGCYSDYTVHAAFTRREDAELAVKGFGENDEARVEEIPLDPEMGEIRDGLSKWRITIYKDGYVDCVRRLNPFDATDDEIHFDDSRAKHIGWAADENQAIKAANEWHARKIASGEWK